jgi:hypothetical protein
VPTLPARCKADDAVAAKPGWRLMLFTGGQMSFMVHGIYRLLLSFTCSMLTIPSWSLLSRSVWLD